MSLFRPDIERMEGYIPGEQPQQSGWIKLNTNENPYPPSPRVAEAVQKAAQGRLNIYPDPLATRFRKAAAKLFDVDPEWILPANGSDENLTLLVRTFVDPGETISYPYPSYVLYETLAEIQGAKHERLLLNADWSWNQAATRPIVERSKLVFVPNPNSPSGNRWSDTVIRRLVPPEGVLVLDEAYGDFCDEPHQAQMLRGKKGGRIVITRTLSKSYSLAGIRMGFAIAHPDLIAGMRKVKDSYNCNTLTLAAATAALEDQEWMLQNRARILGTRERLASELKSLGFDVVDSQTNFLWARHAEQPHPEIYQKLRDRRILLRYMKFPGAAPSTGRTKSATDENEVFDGLRITVGTDPEIDDLLTALKEIL